MSRLGLISAGEANVVSCLELCLMPIPDCDITTFWANMQLTLQGERERSEDVRFQRQAAITPLTLGSHALILQLHNRFHIAHTLEI